MTDIAARRWFPLPLSRRARRRRATGREPLIHSREKRLLLATLALLVVLPFPMNEPQPTGVVGWTVVLVYEAFVGFFMWQVRRGRDTPLPGWLMNLLGLAYLPWLVVRLRTLAPAHIASPMVELLMFGLVVKLYSMRREKDKWHIATLIFFLFVAAMATSSHPLIVVYLLLFLGLWLLLLFGFLHLQLVASYARADRGPGFSPRYLVAAVAIVVLIASLPFFTLLPRLRSPYILGQGVSAEPRYGAGFSDTVSLDVVGRIRQNPTVALRMKPEEATVKAPSLLRGTTYDIFQHNSWGRSQRRQEVLRPTASNLYRLAEGDVETKIRFWLEPIDTRSLILPQEAVSVEISQRLYTDNGGGVLVTRLPDEVLEYRAGIGARPVHRAEEPDFGAEEGEPTLDRSGLTPRIEDLAERLADGLPPAGAAQRIEQYLAQSFGYTLDFVGREAEHPIEDFLFRYRTGHCEYFATAMILMLRSEGIPARLVTGFFGAEFNPLEDYYIVRQSNAHAWVEAYLPEAGWTTFDPTPAVGRPASELDPSWRTVLRQAWDYVEFRWDRYVISYDVFDQFALLLRLRSLLRRLERPSRLPFFDPERRAEKGARPDLDVGPARDTTPMAAGPLLLFVLVAVVLVLAGAVLLRHRRSRSVQRSYRKLRAVAARHEATLGEATGPLTLRRWIERHLPQVAGPSRSLIDLYLADSWQGRRLRNAELLAARRHLRQVKRGLASLRASSSGRPQKSR